MQLLYLTFADSQRDPLAALTEECNQVSTLLARREKEGHYRLSSDANASLAKIADQLLLNQSELVLFHYAGHAGRDRLLLREGAANAEGIARLLGRCPKLRLVVLNGCSTRGQVDELLRQGVPVVIATSAAVGDRAATQFAISFYQAMAENKKSIREAFADGIAAAQAQSRQPFKEELNLKARGILLEDADGDQPLWGLYCRQESDPDWRLPAAREHLLKIPQRLTYVPPVNLEDVDGRTTDIENIGTAISQHQGKIIALTGMGGIGKTTLLKAWHQQHKERFDYQAWIELGSSVDVGFMENDELAINLDVKSSIKEFMAEGKALSAFSAILNRLRELSGQNLLMIDNAGEDLVNPAIINRLADLLPAWTIVVTSRRRFSHPVLHCLELAFLTEPAAADLFRHHFPKAGDAELKELFTVLSPHPQALTLSAKSLANSTTIRTVRELVHHIRHQRISEELKEAIFQTAESEEEADIYMHLSRVFQLFGLSDYQRWLLIQLTALPATHIKEHHLQLLLQVPAGEGHKKLNNNLQALYNLGWLNGSLESRQFFLHRMLQWVVGFQTDFKLEDCRGLVDALYRIYQTNDLDHFIPFFKPRQQGKLGDDHWLLKRYFTRLKPFDPILESVLARVPGIEDHEDYYRLYFWLAHYQKDTGQFQKALGSFQSYLDAALHFGDDTVPFAMDAFHFVIETLLEQSSKASLFKAEGYLEDMEEYVNRHPDWQDFNRARFLVLHGKYLRIIGEYEEARSCLSEALDILEGQAPSDPPNIAAAQASLALVLQDLGDYAGAKVLLEKALHSNERNFGPDHPSTAVIYSNLGLLLKDLGDYAGAKVLLEKAVQSDERNFGLYNPSTARSYSNLSMVFKDFGDYAGAKVLLEKAVQSDERHFGPDHPSTAVRYSNLATVLHGLGDYAGAKDLLEKALQSNERNFGPDHPSTAGSCSNLAMVLQDMGDYAGAMVLLEKALQSYERNFGPDHPNTAVSYTNLGVLFAGLGDYENSRKQISNAHAIFRNHLGEEHPSTQTVSVLLKQLDEMEGGNG